MATDVHTEEHPDVQDDRSLVGLIKELRDETTTLFRQEVALAKTEMSEKASRVGRNIGYLTVGGAIAYAGAMVLLFAATAGLYVGLVAMGLSNTTAGWLAPLIVGGVLAIVGYGLVQKAITALRNESAVPERTARTLQEDKDWAKEKVR